MRQKIELKLIRAIRTYRCIQRAFRTEAWLIILAASVAIFAPRVYMLKCLLSHDMYSKYIYI